MNIALTLLAAMLLGVGLVLQQHAAEQAPKAYFMHLRLIRDLARRPRWLIGIAVMLAGNLLAGWEIGHLPLALTEPLLTSSLVFALALAVPLSGQRLRATELIGAVILSGGVAALSVAREVAAPSASFGSYGSWPAAAGIAAVAYCFVHAGHRRCGSMRAILTGVGTGLVFGIGDALTRTTVQIMVSHTPLAIFTSWPPYCLVATTLVGLWLMENAFNAAPLHTSLPAMTAAEPVAGILLGIVVFGDAIRTSPGMLALQAAGIAALIIGVIIVARAPVFSDLRRGKLGPRLSGPPPVTSLELPVAAPVAAAGTEPAAEVADQDTARSDLTDRAQAALDLARLAVTPAPAVELPPAAAS